MIRFPCKKLLQIKLCDRNHAWFFQNPTFKLISTLSTSTDQPSFTVNYLIDSCGFSPETALSVSQKFNLKTPDNPDSVLDLLKNHEFSETHIRELLRKRPMVLLANIDKTLKPKLQFLLDLGIPRSEISELVASNPAILKRSLEKQLKPSFNFFMGFVQTNENFITALKRYGLLLTYDLQGTIVPNVSVLQKHGVPNSNISKLIMTQPRTLMLKPEKFAKIVATIEELGFNPELLMFVQGVRAMTSSSKLTWESKLETFRSFGCSEDEILRAFKKEPMCMMISEKKIRRGMDFFVNKLNWKPSDLCSCSKLLMYGLETRVMPRCAVMKILASQKLVNKDLKLVWIMALTEKDFMAKYVIKFQEQVPDVLKAYQGKMGGIF